MKHYPHHIGDFNNATRHLTRLERSVYRDLIDLYYDTEQALMLDKSELCRKILARSSDEAAAVEQVLNEFFTETPTGWYHERCDSEISAYHNNTSQKAMAGKASAAAKRMKKLQALAGASTHVEHPLNSVCSDGQQNSTNHQPSTINQSTKGEGADKPLPPTSRKKREQTTLADFLKNKKTEGVKPVPDDHPIRKWCEDASIAPEMLQVAWVQFKERYTEGEKGKGKRYKDWAGHFATAVKSNWFKLWFKGDDGAASWTTQGLMLKGVLDKRMAQKGGDHGHA